MTVRSRFAVHAVATLALTVGLVMASALVPAHASDSGLAVLRSPAASETIGLSAGPEVGWNAGLTDMRPPSASYYRLWDNKTAWRDINPSRGNFDWSILDRRIAQVEGWGGRPILVLGLTPEWAATDLAQGNYTWGPGSASPPSNNEYFREYVRAVVQRYGSRIGAYEVWNEANLQTFWQGSVEQMVELVKIASSEIGGAATVLAPSVTTRLPSGAKWSAAFARALGEANAGVIGGWALHTYPAGNAGPTPDSACKARVDGIASWQNALVAAVGDSSSFLKKLQWDTEVNYGLAGPGLTPPTDWSDADGARLLLCTFRDSRFMGLDVTVWYEYTAEPYDLLGVQMTPNTPAILRAWSSLGASTSGGSANSWVPQTSTPSSSSSSTPSLDANVEQQSIRIRGKLVGKAGDRRVSGNLDSTGLAGTVVAMYVADGQNRPFKYVKEYILSKQGTLLWTAAVTEKQVSVYFQTRTYKANTDHLKVASNRLRLK